MWKGKMNDHQFVNWNVVKAKNKSDFLEKIEKNGLKNFIGQILNFRFEKIN